MSRLGYGAMRLSGQPGNWGPYPDPEGAGQVLLRALEIGVNLIDTAYAYGAGLNETLIAQSLQPYPDGLVIATKCGQTKMGPGVAYKDGRRKAIRTGCEASLKHLRVERLDLLQLHWSPPGRRSWRRRSWLQLCGAFQPSQHRRLCCRRDHEIHTAFSRYIPADRRADSRRNSCPCAQYASDHRPNSMEYRSGRVLSSG
nr:aldo/keto reductase [Bosea caraganae]